MNSQTSDEDPSEPESESDDEAEDDANLFEQVAHGDVSYNILKAATNKDSDKLIDSTGYSYKFKATNTGENFEVTLLVLSKLKYLRLAH